MSELGTERKMRCLIGALALLAGCANMNNGLRSEVPLDEAQLPALPTGLTLQELIQRIGPPAEEQVYGRLDETVDSWRLIEAGNRHMLFNAHFDPSGKVKFYSRSIDPTSIGGDESM